MYDYQDYEDFYGELREYDQMVSELKEALKKSVNQEWVDKMNALEKENAELKEVKMNFEQIKKDYKKKEYILKSECDKAKRESETNARMLRLKELMTDLQVTLWSPSISYMHEQKCDKCDDGRVIRFKSPTGKEYNEKCPCDKSITIYEPIECVLYKIAVRNSYDKEVSCWLTHITSGNDDYYKNTTFLDKSKIIKDDIDFETLRNVESIYDLFFETYDKCEEFCKWYTKEVKGVDTSQYITEEEYKKETVSNNSKGKIKCKLERI